MTSLEIRKTEFCFQSTEGVPLPSGYGRLSCLLSSPSTSLQSFLPISSKTLSDLLSQPFVDHLESYCRRSVGTNLGGLAPEPVMASYWWTRPEPWKDELCMLFVQTANKWSMNLDVRHFWAFPPNVSSSIYKERISMVFPVHDHQA